MGDWKDVLKADPTDWLLEPENAPIRYWTLVDLLERPLEDPEVLAVRAAIPAYPPVADLLAAQQPDGYWSRTDYYLPRASRGTFWVLTVLADLGFTAESEPIRRACDFLFEHQSMSGVFSRCQRVPGQGLVWREDAYPCTQARIVRFLIQFGYRADPRLGKTIDWLMVPQRQDGMYFCRAEGRRGCLRATIDILRVAALDPQVAARPAIAQAARSVCGLLLEPRMSRYHVGEAWGAWESLKYPYFGFSVISALDALARLGYSPAEPKVAAALRYLLSRQLPDGAWPMDESWPHPPIDFGQPGLPSKWLTLDALRVVKLLYRQ